MQRLPGANNSMNSSVSRGVRGNAALRMVPYSYFIGALKFALHRTRQYLREITPFSTAKPPFRSGAARLPRDYTLFNRRPVGCAPRDEALLPRDHASPAHLAKQRRPLRAAG